MISNQYLQSPSKKTKRPTEPLAPHTYRNAGYLD